MAKFQEVFDNGKNILEKHELRVTESKIEYMFLPFNNSQSPSADIIINENVMRMHGPQISWVHNQYNSNLR